MKRVVLSAGGSRILGPDPGRLLHVNPENAGDLRMLSWLPENVSTYGGDIDSILYLIYYITGAWFFLTLGTIVLFLFLYRRREGRPATYVHGNTLDQSAWILVPGPDGQFGTADDLQLDNELHVPVGKVARVTLKSKDVIHSFFLPNLRLKQDVVPGREIEAWFVATKPGGYEIPCAELCGFGHSGMVGPPTVHSADDYEAWLKRTWPSPQSSSARLSAISGEPEDKRPS